MIFRCLAVVLFSVVSANEQWPGIFDDDLYQNVLDPELCKEQMETTNPREFYDASFRIPNGVLVGDLVSLGNYHRCLQIDQENGEGSVKGKYCMMSVTSEDSINIPVVTGNSWSDAAWTTLNISQSTHKMKKYERIISKLATLAGAENARLWQNGRLFQPVPVSLAVCIPKACTVEEIMAPLVNNSIVPFRFTEQFCRLPEDKPLSGADYAAIVIFSIIGFLTVLSTGYDLYHTFGLKKDPKEANKLYSCCSVYTNMKSLLTFSKTPGSLACLDGIRSLSITWIILGHVYSNYLILYTVNLLEFFEWYGKKRAIWLLSADVAVDTFFTMSGLLLVYTAANKMTPMKLLKNLHWFYLNRLLRMFPLLACVTLLQASVFFRVTDGPNWWLLANHVHNCRQYWWSTLLHIQNWVNPLSMCVPQTWYISVDIQLHLLSPILLFWVLRGRRSAWSAFTVVLATVLITSTVYCFVTDFSGSGDFFTLYYYNTLIRGPPFIIGMIFGYLLHTVRGTKVRLPLGLVTIGFILALVGSSYAMYQAYPNWDSQVIDNLNLSFEKSLWALSICWMIYVCVCGYGGPINWFLSLKIWKFTARISYAMYIFHFSIMFTHAGSMTLPFYYSMENIFFTFGGIMVYTVIVSIAACVLIDAPCSTLQKMMMNALSQNTRKRQTVSKLNNIAEDGLKDAKEEKMNTKTSD